jgi:hypothetical protein
MGTVAQPKRHAEEAIGNFVITIIQYLSEDCDAVFEAVSNVLRERMVPKFVAGCKKSVSTPKTIHLVQTGKRSVSPRSMNRHLDASPSVMGIPMIGARGP